MASGRSGWSRVGEGGGNPREPEAVLDEGGEVLGGCGCKGVQGHAHIATASCPHAAWAPLFECDLLGESLGEAAKPTLEAVAD